MLRLRRISREDWKDLWLMGNQVSDITPLVGLTKLQELNLRDNPLPEDQIEKFKKVLPRCEVWFEDD